MEKLASDLGGEPSNYAKLARALIAQVHGTALLLLGEGVEAGIAKEFKDVCLEACQTLIECAGKRIGKATSKELQKIEAGPRG
jgi:hypothetical protein